MYMHRGPCLQDMLLITQGNKTIHQSVVHTGRRGLERGLKVHLDNGINAYGTKKKGY